VTLRQPLRQVHSEGVAVHAFAKHLLELVVVEKDHLLLNYWVHSRQRPDAPLGFVRHLEHHLLFTLKQQTHLSSSVHCFFCVDMHSSVERLAASVGCVLEQLDLDE
jgi:hypothetical protein